VGKVQSKKNAVRMLEQATRLISRSPELRMSGRATGRLLADLHKYIAMLKRLDQDDPLEQEFWECLQKAISKFVRCLLQARR